MHRAIAIALAMVMATLSSGQAAFGQTTLPSVSLDVAPTALSLAPGKTGLLTITNHGAAPVTVQVEATDWRQESGRDVLTPSDTLFVSPPLAHIAPGAHQTVRVMAQANDGREHAYRLVIGQLPEQDAGNGAVTVLLEFRVPVFVGAPRAAPHLTWAAQRGNDGMLVSVRNDGLATVKLTGLKADGAAMADAMVYLLPGSAHTFSPLPSAALVHLTGLDGLSGKPVVADLTPEP